MNAVLPPVCLILALAMLVAGFGLLAVDPPQPTVEMHRAGAEGDEQYYEALEEQLRHRQLRRTVLLVCLFTGSGIMVVTAFLTMRPTKGHRG